MAIKKGVGVLVVKRGKKTFWVLEKEDKSLPVVEMHACNVKTQGTKTKSQARVHSKTVSNVYSHTQTHACMHVHA